MINVARTRGGKTKTGEAIRFEVAAAEDCEVARNSETKSFDMIVAATAVRLRCGKLQGHLSTDDSDRLTGLTWIASGRWPHLYLNLMAPLPYGHALLSTAVLHRISASLYMNGLLEDSAISDHIPSLSQIHQLATLPKSKPSSPTSKTPFSPPTNLPATASSATSTPPSPSPGPSLPLSPHSPNHHSFA